MKNMKMMRKTGLVIVLCLGILLSHNDVIAQSQENITKMEKISKDTARLQLNVEGMSCQAGCANGIDNMLKDQKGIYKSKTTYATGTSLIWYDKTMIAEDMIIALIEDRGFGVEKITDANDGNEE